MGNELAGWPGRDVGLLDFYADRYESDDILLTVFVPVLNEAPNIVPTLETIRAAADAANITFEVLVFDDASTDGTPDKVRHFMAENPNYPVTLVAHTQRRGVAKNYVDGAFIGRGKYYRFASGDNVESQETFQKIFSSIGQADVIIPFHAESYGRTKFRLFLSGNFTRIINFVSGRNIKYYNGGQVYRRVHIMRYHVDTGGFSFQAELLTRILDLGVTWKEVGVVAKEREFGTSKAITIHNFFSAGYCLIKIVAWRLRSRLFG